MAENELDVSKGARLRSGRYELERILGRGGAATVWLATDTLLDRPVAIKVLAEGLGEDPAWLARFRREARVAAQLSHPNLVSVYDFEADAERPYLVMAYMSGGSLRDRLSAEDCPEPERVAVDVLHAIEHIHAHGIIHRDIKPGNVLLDRDGGAHLSDFGIARPEDATSITRTGQIPGTGAYMAPELWRGEPATERSDLYSTGVLLAEYLGGEDASPLADLVRRLAAEDPSLRPDSASAALAAITPRPAPAPAIFEEPTMPAQEGAPATASRERRWLPVVALCAVALVAGVAVNEALDGDGGAQRGPQADPGATESSAGTGSAPETESDAPADEGQVPVAEDGATLNDRGFDLIGAGRYEEAIPVLERAVAAFPEGTTDLNYAFALYNLGNAYYLAGRPDDAIPVLEDRLQIPNQTETVRETLEAAREAAGD